MDARPDPVSPNTRAARRRLGRAARQRAQRSRAEREAFLRSQLEPGESVVARSGDHPWVTDRRILWARPLQQPPRIGELVCESLRLTEIRSWASGRQHDGRPLLRLEHTAASTTLAFGRASNPVYVAVLDALGRASVPEAAAFETRPDGTRQDRLGGTQLIPVRSTSLRLLGFRVERVADGLYRGRLAWRVRLPSWLIVAVPAWLIQPWLVIPAILLAELGWIVYLQVAWRREHRRRSRRG